MTTQGISRSGGRGAPSPDLEEVKEESGSYYEALNREYLSLQEGIHFYNTDNFTWINPQGTKEVNRNNPYIAQVWKLAEKIEKFQESELSVEKLGELMTLRNKVLGLQNSIFWVKAKPFNKYAEECNACCEVCSNHCGCLVCLATVVVGIVLIIFLPKPS